MYVAHRDKVNGERLETVREHLDKTAKLAGEFAAVFQNEDIAYICGLLHDIGKYSAEFQKRIMQDGTRCDHATAGARVLKEKYSMQGELLGNVIAGHHSGLLNYGFKTDLTGEGTYLGRFRKELPDYSAYKEEFAEEEFKPMQLFRIKPAARKDFGYTLYFFLKMIFSCVVDADCLKTKEFMEAGRATQGMSCDFSRMLDNIIKKIEKFPKTGEVCRIRNQVYRQCLREGMADKGVFSLTVPTGGGKTLSSMAFSIKHLIRHNMKRIIYVIPYTTIIEQNSAVFQSVSGENAVLEHHSNYDFDDTEEKPDIRRLASENWDAPVIVTTNVQFFESLYSHKTGKSRKLHNIADSVIVFDEVQMLPTPYLLPCMRVIEELVLNYGCTSVLCSATQPELGRFLTIPVSEICSDVEEIYRVLNRVELKWEKMKTMEELAGEINRSSQCLVIVNTKKQAGELFGLLEGEGSFHLSTYMCPCHRSRVISEIRERLDRRLDCRVVSTSLVEAGVDLDFPLVYRAVTGLDSVIQSSGRCNREGRLRDNSGRSRKGTVIVFELQEEEMKKSSAFWNDLYNKKTITKQIFEAFDSVFTTEAIASYYRQLYVNYGEDRLDSKRLLKRITKSYRDRCMGYDFKDIGEDFKIIEDEGCAVMIPYNGEAEEIIRNLKYTGVTMGVLRSMQRYTVTVRNYEFKQLCEQNRIERIGEYSGILVSAEDYGTKGLKLEMEYGRGYFA